MVGLHGVLIAIISYRSEQFTASFTAQFLKSFQKGLGSRVDLSTSFHPQTDGQTKCTIQTLEEMLRDFVIQYKGNVDDHIPLIEFAYNSSYHSIIQMAP